LLLILGLTAGASAQQERDASAQAAQATRICADLKNFSLPAVAEPPGGCPDPIDLYDHAMNGDDFRKAARCAQFYWERDAHPAENDTSATLILLYANGQGVPRNADYATHIVCRIRSTFETDKALNQLIVELDASRSGRATKWYTYCNLGFELDQGVEYGCAQEAFEDAQNKRLDHLKLIASKWTAAQRSSFNAVLKAHDAYADANSSAESPPGTGRGASMLEVQDNVNQEFAADIDRLEQRKLPKATHLDYVHANQDLNSGYRKVWAELVQTKAQDPDEPGPRNLLAAERAWLVYRDAFVAFAKLRWPQVSPDSWLTFLTRERIARLEKANVV
jgi:uncharacterized protein YecT (DUF1311 family)